MLNLLTSFAESMGLRQLFELMPFTCFGIDIMIPGTLIMLLLGVLFIYLGAGKKIEPYLMIPIGFGMFLANFPSTGLMDTGGLLRYLYAGIEMGIFPPLIFLCIGASTDFGPLIAYPKSLLLGAAAQLGICLTFIGAIALGFTGREAASIGIIGGASGPTTLSLTTVLAPHLLSAVGIAAYSYMALVPIIQPPLIRLCTTQAERKIKMDTLRPVGKTEKLIFCLVVTALSLIITPSSAPLIGMLMLGNLIQESGVLGNMSRSITDVLMYILTLFIGLTIGAKATAANFLNVETLSIILLGLLAFSGGTVGGLLFGKLLCILSGGKVNPMIGAAGVSAVPMSARVVQVEAQKADKDNFILMQAMGPNVAGAIAAAVAAGLFLQMFS